MVELADIVVEPEQERADVRARPVLVPPEARDHAVGRALVLDLDHRPLARQVRPLEPLRDDAIEARALEAVEPVEGEGPVGRGRGQVDRGRRSRERRLEPAPSLRLRRPAEVLVVEREQVPGHE